MAEFVHIIPVVDVHTDGEPARIVLSGVPSMPGGTMDEKKQYMAVHLDHIRTLLLHEPRGHKDMFGVILTSPTTNAANYGILFMDSAGYIDMCGHSIMGATMALISMGTVVASEPETRLVFDTPAGLVESRAHVVGNRVVDVSISNVPSFLYKRDLEIELPDMGAISVDVSFGGNFFAMVSAEKLGVAVHLSHYTELVRLGMAIRDAVNEKARIQHPTKPHIKQVALTEIYEKPSTSGTFSRSVVIFGQGQVDRCPCGTGTSAAMAMMHGKGELPLGVEFINESIIGTRFQGILTRETRVGDLVAVEPVITGRSYMTGIQQIVVDPDDPLKYGFAVG